MGELLHAKCGTKSRSVHPPILRVGKFGHHQELHPLLCKCRWFVWSPSAARWTSLTQSLRLIVMLVDDPDSKVNLENAHHPIHEVDIHLEPDHEMLDCLIRDEWKRSAKLDALPEKKMQKVSDWIYPKLHQEITSCPTEFLGVVGDRHSDFPGRLCKNAPVSDHSECGCIVPKPSHIIEGHPDQNSSLRWYKSMEHLHTTDDAIQGSSHHVRFFVPSN